MSNAQRYSISRLHIQSYKCRSKKSVKNIRCRYLAKSQIIRAKADNIKIEFINFRGSNFKKVSFVNTEFYGNDFWGANFNECNFNNTSISHTIFMGCRFKKCTFESTKFNKVVFINSNIGECEGIDISRGVEVLNQYPKIQPSQELLKILDILKSNKNLKKNKLLHLNKNRLNHLNLYLMLKKFTQEDLCTGLLKMKDKNFKDITTYKKLESELKKILEVL